MKKKYLIFVFIFIIFLVGVLFLFNNREHVSLKSDNFIFEYGDNVCSDVKCYLEDADSTKNINEFTLDIGELKSENGFLKSADSEYLNVGKYNLKIKYKEEVKDFSIVVKDTTPPEIVESTDEIILEQNSLDVDLKTYFKISDLSECQIYFSDTYDLSKLGEYNVQVTAADAYNNKKAKEIKIKVIDLEAAKKEGAITKNLDGKLYKSKAMTDYEKSKNAEPKQNTLSTKNNTNENKTSSTNKSTNYSSTNSSASSSPRYRKDISDSYVSQINAYRSSQGLTVLPVTSEAQAEADRRAKEIVANPSHDGSSYGFGENIGGGGIGTDFFQLWMNSHAHYNAIIREQNVAIASSVYEIDGMWYAVVVFRMNY